MDDKKSESGTVYLRGETFFKGPTTTKKSVRKKFKKKKKAGKKVQKKNQKNEGEKTTRGNLGRIIIIVVVKVACKDTTNTTLSDLLLLRPFACPRKEANKKR